MLVSYILKLGSWRRALDEGVEPGEAADGVQEGEAEEEARVAADLGHHAGWELGATQPPTLGGSS